MITARLASEESTTFKAEVALTGGIIPTTVKLKKGAFDMFINTTPPVLSSLEIIGDWNGPCICGHAVVENMTDMAFRAHYANGSYARITPTYAPTEWQETEGQQTITFSYTERGVTVTAGKAANVVPLPKPVGGIVFYIDNEGDGEYRFWDAHGYEAEAPAVGTDCSGWSYLVTGATKEKFYVVRNELFERKRWCPYRNGAYVREVTGFTATGIGSGKTNTAGIMAIDDGAYIQESAAGYPTVWYQIDQMNTEKVGGCNDWFVGSRDELDALRTSGAVNAWFHNNYMWSSSESSDINALLWFSGYNRWEGLNKMNYISMCALRSF